MTTELLKLSNDVCDLLDILHAGGNYSYLQFFDSESNANQSEWRKCGDYRDVAFVPRGRHAYWGVNPTREIVTEKDREKYPDKTDNEIARFVAPKNKTISAMNCVYAEFDAKDYTYPTEREIEEIYLNLCEIPENRAALNDPDPKQVSRKRKALQIESFGAAKDAKCATNPSYYKAKAFDHVQSVEPVPSVIVDSGGGYQAYWLLDETFAITNEDDLKQAANIQKRWVDFVGGDPSVNDLRRILRVVGSTNWKSKYGPNFPTISFVSKDFDLRYSIDEIEECLPEEAGTDQCGPAPSGKRDYEGNSVIDKFNANNDIGDILETYGYKWVSDDRMTRPGDKDMKSKGVQIDTETNRSRHWSQNDPLCDPHWRTPFSVVCALDFDDDPKKAVKEIAMRINDGEAESKVDPECGNDCDLGKFCGPDELNSDNDTPDAQETVDDASDGAVDEQSPQDEQGAEESNAERVDAIIERLKSVTTQDEKEEAFYSIFKIVARATSAFQKIQWKNTLPAKLGINKRDYAELLADAERMLRANSKREVSQPLDTTGVWLSILKRMGHEFRLSVLEDNVEINGKRLDDVTRSKIYLDMVNRGVSKQYVDDVINVAASENSYHPVKDYLNGLEWDGNDHLVAMLNHIRGDDKVVKYVNGDEAQLHWLLIRRWLLGCVARALDGDKEHAFKHQTPMLVFVGKQGIGKSSWVRWLASGVGYEFHKEGPIDPHNQEHVRSAVTKWLWEVSELGSSLRRGDRDALKGFLTQEWHTYRKPWGRASITKPLLANFVGTINSEVGFLDDPTGHRRFLPVNVTSIKKDYENVVPIDQLWAQIVHMYRSGESPELSAAEKKAISEVYVEHEVENPLQTYIHMYFDIDKDAPEMKCSTADIILRLRKFGISVSNNEKHAGREINDALAPLGLTRKKISVSGAKLWGWEGIKPNSIPTPEEQRIEALRNVKSLP